MFKYDEIHIDHFMTYLKGKTNKLKTKKIEHEHASLVSYVKYDFIDRRAHWATDIQYESSFSRCQIVSFLPNILTTYD
jgi:hypothetical protein